MRFGLIATTLLSVALLLGACSPGLERDVHDTRDEVELLRKEITELNETLRAALFQVTLLTAFVGDVTDFTKRMEVALTMFMEDAFEEADLDDLADEEDFDIDGAFGDGVGGAASDTTEKTDTIRGDNL